MRKPIEWSGSGSSATFASRSVSPSAAVALSSRARSCIAPRSASVKRAFAGAFERLLVVLVSVMSVPPGDVARIREQWRSARGERLAGLEQGLEPRDDEWPARGDLGDPRGRARVGLVDDGELLDARTCGLDLEGHPGRRLAATRPRLVVGHREALRS